MTSQKLNEEHEILRHFMAVVVSSAFKNSMRLKRTSKELWASSTRLQCRGSIKSTNPRLTPSEAQAAGPCSLLHHVQPCFAPVQPRLHLCKRLFAPSVQKRPFAPSPKHTALHLTNGCGGFRSRTAADYLATSLLKFGESGWPRNRTGTGNRNRRNRFPRNRTRNRNRRNRFPGTETRTGTVLSVKLYCNTQKPPP